MGYGGGNRGTGRGGHGASRDLDRLMTGLARVAGAAGVVGREWRCAGDAVFVAGDAVLTTDQRVGDDRRPSWRGPAARGLMA